MPARWPSCRGIIAIRSIRLLIAQASVENLPIVSVDTAFDDYAITRLW